MSASGCASIREVNASLEYASLRYASLKKKTVRCFDAGRGADPLILDEERACCDGAACDQVLACANAGCS